MASIFNLVSKIFGNKYDKDIISKKAIFFMAAVPLTTFITMLRS